MILSCKFVVLDLLYFCKMLKLQPEGSVFIETRLNAKGLFNLEVKCTTSL